MPTALASSPFSFIDFIQSSSELKLGSLNILGFPFDGTACFRKGARLGPANIRETFQHIESYSPYLDSDCEALEPIYDLGDIPYLQEPIDYKNKESIDLAWQNAWLRFDEMFKNSNLATSDTRLLSIGGEHSISLKPISLYLKNYENLKIIHLDAHADLRDSWEGFDYSHASVIKRCTDLFGPKHKLSQYGIRSGAREEFEWMKKKNTRATSLKTFLEKLNKTPSTTPLYLTLDLDFLDPSIFSGTGTPEVGGESFSNLMSIFKVLKTKRLVGADIVELAPNLDPSGVSSICAVTVLRELILLLGKNNP